VKLYWQLFPYRAETVQESDQLASTQAVRSAGAGNGDGNRLRFRVVQDELARDLRQILGFTESLKQKLLDERRAKWLSHCLIALGAQAIIAKLFPSLLNILARTCRTVIATANVGSGPQRVGASQRFRPSPEFLGLLHWAQWFAYPIAIFHISRHEKRIGLTYSLREGLMELLREVERGSELGEELVRCLTDEGTWEEIPWGMLERR